LRFGLGLDEAAAGNLLLVDDDLNVIEGEGMPNPSNRFHLWIYRARPAIGAIMHTHPPHVSALSMIGVPLAVSHMDTSLFFEDCAWLREWPGTPAAKGEGGSFPKASADKKRSCLAIPGSFTRRAWWNPPLGWRWSLSAAPSCSLWA